MKKIQFFGCSIMVVLCIASCNNSASDPHNKSSEIGYDSLSTAGDTITTNTSDFSSAVHHMTNDLSQIPVTGNADRDFVYMLKSHQQGELDLAQAELKNGKDASLTQIAQNIVTTQKGEMAVIDKFIDSLKKGPLSVAYSKKDKDSEFRDVVKKHNAMMWDLSKVDTNIAADKQFVTLMIPHLQSAIYLAKGYLNYGKDEWLMRKAKAVIPEKGKQIDQLKNWMDKNKGQE